MEIRRPVFDLFSNLKHIPTLPQILLQLIKVCNQENGGLKEIARIIEKDPALTGRVLKLTNSAYYAPAHRINSVDGAVYFLGTNAIKNIAICSSIHTVLHGIQTKTAFNIKQFWWHSLRCAILAKRMAKKIQYRDPDEAFLSGMLHDIGQIVLWVNFPETYSELLSIYWEQSELMVAEEIRLVASHAEIGAGLLDKWNFPSFVTDAVFYHHAPKNDVFHALPLVKLVYVANCLSSVSGQKNLEGVELAQSFFGMGPAIVKSLMLQVDNELKIVAESLEIEIEQVHSEEIVTTSKDIEHQQKLSKEMEDQALLLGLLQNMLHADDEYAVLNDLYNGIQTLFDLPIVHFFIIDSDRKNLRGTSLLHDPKFSVIKDLIVPLQMEKSLLVSCLKNREIADSYRISDPSATAILDDQIIRFMGKEGMVCLPMISCGEPIGVIVLGMDVLEFSNLSGQIHLLKMLTDQAAAAVRIHLSKRFQLKKILEERLDASSSLARRIIHEINNPMSIIKNYLKLLGIKLFPMDMAQDEIRIINEEIDRISQILSGLTTFSEGWIHQMDMVNLNALLSDLEKILSESLLNQHHVRLQLSLDTALPHILTDRNSLKQVFVNLIKNSAEAIQNGGDLYIRTRHIKGRFENSRLDSGYPEYVEIIVHDDGPGIPEENRNRLFEPFNSTKSGDHAGLGLSIVHNIIETLNGSITCDFEVDQGATFRILLPIGNTEKPLAGR